MSISAIAGAVAKTAITIAKFLGGLATKLGPGVKSAVSAGAVALGAKATTAKALGTAAGIATQLVVSRTVDKMTDATIEKVPVVGEFAGFLVDSMVSGKLLGGVLR
jgi:hypothetical protein